MMFFTAFTLPSGAADKSNISLYSLKRPCKHLDLEGAKSFDTTWAKIAEDDSESSKEVSATGQTVWASFMPDCSVNVKDAIWVPCVSNRFFRVKWVTQRWEHLLVSSKRQLGNTSAHSKKTWWFGSGISCIKSLTVSAITGTAENQGIPIPRAMQRQYDKTALSSSSLKESLILSVPSKYSVVSSLLERKTQPKMTSWLQLSTATEVVT